MTTINALLVPPPRPAALLFLLKYVDYLSLWTSAAQPTGTHHAVSKSFKSVTVCTVMAACYRAQFFFNSLMYFWLFLTSGLIVRGGAYQKLFLCVTLNFGHSVFHRFETTLSAVAIIWCHDMGQWPCVVKFKGLDWSSNSLFQHVPEVDHKTLSQGNWHPDRDLNRVPPMYQVRSITVLTELFVRYLMNPSQP